MRRLGYVVVFTGRFHEMNAFYGDQVGLPRRGGGGPDWAEFDTGAARVALHRMDDPQRQGIVLRFDVEDLDASVADMAARGITFLSPARDFPWGRFAEFVDPEGNPVGLVQPRAARGAYALNVDRLVLSCTRFTETVRFYRDRVGLHASVDTDTWVEFDTGDTRLAMHPRRAEMDRPPHTEQNVTIVLGSNDLMPWVDAMRGRGVHFATAPIEEDFGLYAEAADPDGYMVVFREPPPPVPIEETLAEAFEVDDVPHQVAIRKPAQKPSRASGLIAGLQRRARREAEELRRERDAARAAETEPKTLDVVAARGSGAAGSREKPRTMHDPKRARAKPAIGSLKEAGRKTMAAKKRSVAKRSKAAPVKAAAKSVGRKAAKRVARPAPPRAVKKAVKRAAKRVAKPAAKRAAQPAPGRRVTRATKRVVKRAVRRR
jgi:predicted enzyme related to lactoylglutathione lyase